MKKVLKKHKRGSSEKAIRDARFSFRVAIISSKGQVTIPQDIRDIMHLKRGSIVGFEPTRRGILMVTMKVAPQDPYTENEWRKIEKLSRGKAKVYRTSEEAKKHIASL